jgi:hypothetical protein
MTDLNQGTFDFDDRAPYQSHSTTSKAAAVEAQASAATQRGRVFRLLRESNGGLTDEEIQIQLRMNPSTERPRRIELVNSGMVQDSGATRATRSGRSAVIWTVRKSGAA